MKQKLKMQKWTMSVVGGLALAGSASFCLAANPIVLNTFDNNDLANWQANGSTIEWTATQDAGGTASHGAMMVWYTNSGAAGWQSAQPQRNLASQTFNSGNYWSVAFDFKLDPASSPGLDAPFGHLQIVPIDSGWNWLGGIGWTALTEDWTNWHHVEIGFGPPYADLNAIVFQVGDSGFTGDVIFYVDNIVVQPIPSQLFVTQFTNSTSADDWIWQSWSQPGVSAWNSGQDAGGATPPGALELDCNFNNVPNNYQQVVFQKNFEGDPNRFVYLDLDVKMDPSATPMVNGTTYGGFETIININGNWGWASLGTLNLTSANTNWTHLSWPLGGIGATNMHAITLKLGGGWALDGFTNAVKLYVDNIKFWTPQVPPTLSLKRSGVGGLQITCTAPTDDWQRQNIVTPANPGRFYSWIGLFPPITYSFTITNFPDPVAHPGFEAHMFMVNYDTLVGPGFDETYPGVDWNGADVVIVNVQNNGSGGVDFGFSYKTNAPGTNTYQSLVSTHADSALGRWAVTFTGDTSASLITPSGAQTDFTIPQEVADRFRGQMTLHFGTFKNQIRNNGASATFSRIQVTGVPINIDETFPGPGLNPDPANPFWRLAADPAGLTWIPQGTAWWLTWTMPDTGFSPQSASSMTGPWNDAGITYIFTGATTRSGAVPTAALPSPGTTFFRMVKPVTP